MNLSDQRTRASFASDEPLAVAEPDAPDESQRLDLAILEVGQSKYGLELSALLEVMPASVTPLPLVSRGVAGFMNLRGRIITVLELAVLFGVNDSPPGRFVLMVQSQRYGTVGLLLAQLPTFQSVNLDALQPSSDPVVRGVVEDVTWLELESWLAQFSFGSNQGETL
jgi:chemotaxis signal transduction protein